MGLKKKHRYMFIGFEYAGIIFSSVTGGLILGKILAECAKTVLQNIFYNTITTEVNYGFNCTAEYIGDFNVKFRHPIHCF
mgnify:CR=1 FL=1